MAIAIAMIAGAEGQKMRISQNGEGKKGRAGGAAIKRGGERRVSRPLNLKDARIFHYVPEPYGLGGSLGLCTA